MNIPVPVSSRYCLEQETQLILKPNFGICSGPQAYTIKDVQGSLVFDVKNPGWSTKLTLYDESGLPVALLKVKGTWSSRWTVYRGTEKNDANVLFTFRYRRLSYFKPSICEVYLPSNTSTNSAPDFVMEKEKAFMRGTTYSVLYNGIVIAKAERKTREYFLTISPGVDRAFIGALIVIRDTDQRHQNASATAAAVYKQQDEEGEIRGE